MTIQILVNPNDPDACAWGLLKKLQLNQCVDLPEISPIHGMSVLIEDHGQDFLEFDIKDGQIIETRPFQGFVWDDSRVLNNEIGIGTQLVLSRRGHGEGLKLRYPIAGIAPLFVKLGGVV